MKKAVCVLLSLLLWMFAGCKQMEKQEIIVFAAASLQESLTQITRDYMAEHDVEIVLNFDSSGTLRTQILEGAQCRIFISAGQKQVNGLGMVHKLYLWELTLGFGAFCFGDASFH